MCLVIYLLFTLAGEKIAVSKNRREQKRQCYNFRMPGNSCFRRGVLSKHKLKPRLLGLLLRTARYETYVRAIRQEYSWVAEAAYRTKRVQVLQTFLQRTRIYWTEPMFIALEEQARENIYREISTLS
jgi:hypothetical protein